MTHYAHTENSASASRAIITCVTISAAFTRYGIVSGRLVFLSHDAIEAEELGLVFPARVELSQQTITVNGRATPLTAGMAVTAEIKTGRRRIIEFLLSPIARRVEEAGRER